MQSSHGAASSTDSFGLYESVNGKPPILRVRGLAEGTDAGIGTFYHGDQLGSTRYVTNTDGTRARYAGQRYDAYGRPTPASASLAGSMSQFAGSSGYRSETSGDSDLGLVYCYQRYYDPAAGRWISRDPIGYAGGLNLYGSCDGDPVNGADPLGLKTSNPSEMFGPGGGGGGSTLAGSGHGGGGAGLGDLFLLFFIAASASGHNPAAPPPAKPTPGQTRIETPRTSPSAPSAISSPTWHCPETAGESVRGAERRWRRTTRWPWREERGM